MERWAQEQRKRNGRKSKREKNRGIEKEQMLKK